MSDLIVSFFNFNFPPIFFFLFLHTLKSCVFIFSCSFLIVGSSHPKPPSSQHNEAKECTIGKYKNPSGLIFHFFHNLIYDHYLLQIIFNVILFLFFFSSWFPFSLFIHSIHLLFSFSFSIDGDTSSKSSFFISNHLHPSSHLLLSYFLVSIYFGVSRRSDL